MAPARAEKYRTTPTQSWALVSADVFSQTLCRSRFSNISRTPKRLVRKQNSETKQAAMVYTWPYAWIFQHYDRPVGLEHLLLDQCNIDQGMQRSGENKHSACRYSPPSPRLRRATYTRTDFQTIFCGRRNRPANRSSRSERRLVEPSGIEPLTSSLPAKRSPS